MCIIQVLSENHYLSVMYKLFDIVVMRKPHSSYTA